VQHTEASNEKLTPLRLLRTEKPGTLAGQIRWYWPDIKAALGAGHRLKSVHERLREMGVQVAYKTLSVYVSRLRVQDRRVRAKPPQLEKAARASKVQADTHRADTCQPAEPNAERYDPTAHLRDMEVQRPGFQYNPRPERKKLI
jgi:hypothetical protein